MFDRHKPEQVAEADRLSSFMVHKALEMEGTCTGEHGVGTGKIKYLPGESRLVGTSDAAVLVAFAGVVGVLQLCIKGLISGWSSQGRWGCIPLRSHVCDKMDEVDQNNGKKPVLAYGANHLICLWYRLSTHLFPLLALGK